MIRSVPEITDERLIVSHTVEVTLEFFGVEVVGAGSPRCEVLSQPAPAATSANAKLIPRARQRPE